MDGQNAEGMDGWKKQLRNTHKKTEITNTPPLVWTRRWMDGWMENAFMKNMAVRPGAHVLFARIAVIYSEARTLLGFVILELRS